MSSKAPAVPCLRAPLTVFFVLMSAVVLSVLIVCNQPRPSEQVADPTPPAFSEDRDPFEEDGRKYIPKGFTQQPRPGTVGLPPPAPALLTDEEKEVARAKTANVSAEGTEEAQKMLLSLLEELKRASDTASAKELEGLLERIRDRVIQQAREGRVSLLTAAALHKEYLHPNEKAADKKYKGKLVVLKGTVVPHNMADIEDPYKLFRTEPYAHEPVLLQTDYDLSYVHCQLAKPSLQKLVDWQEIHVVGIVEGKDAPDVVMRQCTVL